MPGCGRQLVKMVVKTADVLLELHAEEDDYEILITGELTDTLKSSFPTQHELITTEALCLAIQVHGACGGARVCSRIMVHECGMPFGYHEHETIHTCFRRS